MQIHISRIFIYPYDKTIFHKNTVIFFMRQGDHNMDEELIINLLKVFQKYNYKIYFKNHPIVHFGPSSMAYKLSKLPGTLPLCFSINCLDNK